MSYVREKQASVDRKATKRGNGTGTVYKRGSSWVAEITKGYREEDGKLTRVKAKMRLPHKTRSLRIYPYAADAKAP